MKTRRFNALQRLIVVVGLAAAGLTVSGAAPVHAATGCLATPSACGWPDATNTGWFGAGFPTLTSHGSYNITSDGPSCGSPTVIDAMDVTGSVIIDASNIEFKRSRITASGNPAVVVEVKAGHTCVKVHNDTIIGDHTPGQIGVTGTNNAGNTVVFNKLDVSDVEVGVKLQTRSSLTNSYVHSLNSSGGSPVYVAEYWAPGFTSTSDNHNTLVAPTGSGYGIYADSTTAPSGTFAAANDLLGGGQWNMKITDGTGTNVMNSAQSFQGQFSSGSSGYVTRNRAIVVNIGNPNLDDATGANINASL